MTPLNVERLQSGTTVCFCHPLMMSEELQGDFGKIRFMFSSPPRGMLRGFAAVLLSQLRSAFRTKIPLPEHKDYYEREESDWQTRGKPHFGRVVHAVIQQHNSPRACTLPYERFDSLVSFGAFGGTSKSLETTIYFALGKTVQCMYRENRVILGVTAEMSSKSSSQPAQTSPIKPKCVGGLFWSHIPFSL